MAVPEKLRVEAAECQRRLEPFKASLTDAVDFFLRHAKPPGGHRTVKALVDEFIAAKRAAGRRSEYTRIQASILGMFEKAFPHRHAHEIGAPEIETWLRDRGSLRTRRNYQFDVRNLFNFALKRGYVASNPVNQLEEIILDEKPVEILTVEQAGRLLEAAELAGGTMTPFVAVGLFAGLRTREIAVLDWKDIDLAEKTITVHAVKTKTRARRIVEIADNLAAWLRPYALAGGPIAPDHYRPKFEDTRRAAGIDPWPRNAMRHSAASYHLGAHRNESLTQAMLGHESGKMLIQHYRELVRPKDAARYWQIMPATAEPGKIVALSA